jgi:pilus assembly protein Flp/PilA
MLGFLSDPAGSTAVEYGLIAGLIAVALIAGLSGIGGGIQNVMNLVSNSLVTP